MKKIKWTVKDAAIICYYYSKIISGFILNKKDKILIQKLQTKEAIKFAIKFFGNSKKEAVEFMKKCSVK